MLTRNDSETSNSWSKLPFRTRYIITFAIKKLYNLRNIIIIKVFYYYSSIFEVGNIIIINYLVAKCDRKGHILVGTYLF